MNVRSYIATISQHDGLNFILTNGFPRRLATRFVGWFSRIEQPWVRDLSIRVWRIFCDIDLSEAKKTRFTSLRDCFVRELKEGARPVNPDPIIVTSPCDGIVGACGRVEDGELFQVKGSRYPLAELLGDAQLAESYDGGCYVTLRLTAGMYHRFHAPQDCRVEAVTHLWGEVWNVNPPTLARVDKLFCRNERAVIQTQLEQSGERLTLIAVAAVLVAGIRLRFLDLVVDPRCSLRPIAVPCTNRFHKGQEMGWFEHGSTIILLSAKGTAILDTIRPGSVVCMGEALLKLASCDRE